MDERKQYVNELYFKMARERRQLLQKISCLEKQVSELEARLNCYNASQSTIPPVQFSSQIREWMNEHKMPWEVFWCNEHRQWFDELDNSFPYFTDSSCPRCRGE